MTTRTATPPAPLASLSAQADRLVALGLHATAGVSEAELRVLAAEDAPAGALLVLHHRLLPTSTLAPVVRWRGQAGFVVTDLTDVDAFGPTVDVPDRAAYVVLDPTRGDEMSGRSPAEALPAITGAGRTPLTLSEGLHWVLQQPDVLERNHCFMTLGTRRRRPNGSYDARTPAVWISNGSGRDGRAHRHAPKVGWCWWNNRHTWLGFATAAGRHWG